MECECCAGGGGVKPEIVFTVYIQGSSMCIVNVLFSGHVFFKKQN